MPPSRSSRCAQRSRGATTCSTIWVEVSRSYALGVADMKITWFTRSVNSSNRKGRLSAADGNRRSHRHGLEHDFDRLAVRLQVRREAALVADIGVEALVVQRLFQSLEHLDERLSKIERSVTSVLDVLKRLISTSKI